MSTSFAFLSNLRGAIAGRSQAPTGGSGGRRRLRLNLQPTQDGVAADTTISSRMQVLGAGDITALDSRMIAAVEPRPGSRGVEPNYFPYVDFIDADFLWRYSLDVSDGARVKPWLALIALNPSEFRFLDRGIAPLTRIEITNPSASLPDLQQSWATAHVQLNVAHGKTPLNVLRNDPSAQFCRLFCHRRLQDNSRYHLLLVPVFEAGRLTGLGNDVEPGLPFAQLAWDFRSETPQVLPVYKSWQFTTSVMEDFESLAGRLNPIESDASSAVGGTRQIHAGHPGYYRNYARDNESFAAEGALQGLEFKRTPATIQKFGYSKHLVNTLNQVIAGETLRAADGPDQDDPLVALPAYGSHHSQVGNLSLRPQTRRWVHELNLDLRFRLGAGAGARIVKRNQAYYMNQCWQQIGDLQAANQLRNRLKLADQLVGNTLKRHFDKIPDHVALDLAAPMTDLVTRSQNSRSSVAAELQRQGMPAGQTGPGVRRLIARRSVNRRDSATGKVNRGSNSSFVSLSANVHRSRIKPMTGANITKTNSLQQKARLALSAARLNPAPGQRSTGAQSASAISVARPNLGVLQARINPAVYVTPVRTRLIELPLRKSKALTQGIRGPAAQSLEPIMAAPRIPEALADELKKEDLELLMPGVGEMPMNSVALLQENKAFMEAVLAGANHEMARELRWNEFPTDMRGSVFTRFWDRGAAPDDSSADDVKPLHNWHNPLGRNGQRQSTSLVLIIKGELVRRYPELLVALNKQTLNQGASWTRDKGTTYDPVFAGRLGADTAYFGFNVQGSVVRKNSENFFAIIYEPPGRFRFGLDVANYEVRQQRLDLSRAPIPFPVTTANIASRALRADLSPSRFKTAPTQASATLNSTDDLSWSHVRGYDDLSAPLEIGGYINFDASVSVSGKPWGSDRAADSANLARAFFQKPMRVVIPMTRLINDD